MTKTDLSPVSQIWLCVCQLTCPNHRMGKDNCNTISHFQDAPSLFLCFSCICSLKPASYMTHIVAFLRLTSSQGLWTSWIEDQFWPKFMKVDQSLPKIGMLFFRTEKCWEKKIFNIVHSLAAASPTTCTPFFPYIQFQKCPCLATVEPLVSQLQNLCVMSIHNQDGWGASLLITYK